MDLIFYTICYYEYRNIKSVFFFTINCFVFYLLIFSGHPNVKLFITHSGNSGTIEATSAGIPVLGIPIFFDQPRNLELFK